MRAKEYEEFIGKRLLDDIYDTNDTLLIRKGTVLLNSHIEKLANFRIKTADINAVKDDRSSPKSKPSDNRDAKAKRAREQLNEIDYFVHHNGIVPIADVEEKVLPFIKETAERYNLFQVFYELKEQGDYRYRQIIGVAVLATALGRQLQMDEDELALLTTAAILYDVGSVKLPSTLINKPAKFDIHEYAIMKQHTILGYKLLLESKVDPRIALVAEQHHEREDGSGYPKALKAEQIDRLSKIVALADVYVAMISDRPYRSAYPFFDVIDHIHQQIVQNHFDPVIGLQFLDLLLSRQNGCEVILSDNRRGKILLTDVNYPSKPLIVLDDHEFVDLSKLDDVVIKEVIG